MHRATKGTISIRLRTRGTNGDQFSSSLATASTFDSASVLLVTQETSPLLQAHHSDVLRNRSLSRADFTAYCISLTSPLSLSFCRNLRTASHPYTFDYNYHPCIQGLLAMNAAIVEPGDRGHCAAHSATTTSLSEHESIVVA